MIPRDILSILIADLRNHAGSIHPVLLLLGAIGAWKWVQKREIHATEQPTVVEPSGAEVERCQFCYQNISGRRLQQE